MAGGPEHVLQSMRERRQRSCSQRCFMRGCKNKEHMCTRLQRKYGNISPIVKIEKLSLQHLALLDYNGLVGASVDYLSQIFKQTHCSDVTKQTHCSEDGVNNEEDEFLSRNYTSLFRVDEEDVGIEDKGMCSDNNSSCSSRSCDEDYPLTKDVRNIFEDTFSNVYGGRRDVKKKQSSVIGESSSILCAGKNSTLHEKYSTLREKNSSLREKSSKLGEKSSTLGEKSSKLGEKSSKLGEKSSTLCEKSAVLGEREKLLAKLKRIYGNISPTVHLIDKGAHCNPKVSKKLPDSCDNITDSSREVKKENADASERYQVQDTCSVIVQDLGGNVKNDYSNINNVYHEISSVDSEIPSIHKLFSDVEVCESQSSIQSGKKLKDANNNSAIEHDKSYCDVFSDCDVAINKSDDKIQSVARETQDSTSQTDTMSVSLEAIDSDVEKKSKMSVSNLSGDVQKKDKMQDTKLTNREAIDKSVDITCVDAKTLDAEFQDTKCVDAKTPDSKCFDENFVVVKSADARFTEEAKSADTNSAYAKSVDTKSVVISADAQSSADAKSTDVKPSTDTGVDNRLNLKSVVGKSVERKPIERRLVERKTVYGRSLHAKELDVIVIDDKSCDNNLDKSFAKKLVNQKNPDTKVDAKPTDTKQKDTKLPYLKPIDSPKTHRKLLDDKIPYTKYQDSSSGFNKLPDLRPITPSQYRIPDLKPVESKLGSKRNLELGLKRNPELGSKRNPELGLKRNPELGLKRNPELGSKHTPAVHSKLGSKRNPELGLKRTNPEVHSELGSKRNPEVIDLCDSDEEQPLTKISRKGSQRLKSSGKNISTADLDLIPGKSYTRTYTKLFEDKEEGIFLKRVVKIAARNERKDFNNKTKEPKSPVRNERRNLFKPKESPLPIRNERKDFFKPKESPSPIRNERKDLFKPKELPSPARNERKDLFSKPSSPMKDLPIKQYESRQRTCPVCGVSFKLAKELSDHKALCLVKSVHVKRNYCSECHFSYTTQGDLARHVTYHKNLANIMCKVCGLTFQTSFSFDSHRQIHLAQI